MENQDIFILAVLQGLTEFLPVSSSGHLILAPTVFGFQDQGQALDAILHLGTLLSIVIFFRKDLWTLFLGLVSPKADPKDKRLAWNIIWATFPAGIVGLLFADAIETHLRSPTFVACNLLIWSGIFYYADRMERKRSKGEVQLNSLGFKQVMLIGCAQAAALLPGTSRSGVTICAGLFSGLTQAAAARFSFLLGTPIITAAGLHKTLDVLKQPEGELLFTYGQLGMGLLISFLVGYLAIHALLKIVARVGLLPFIVYRVCLAGIILAYFGF